MMKINCIAIDDEPLALDVITNFSSRISFINLERVFFNPLEAIDFLNSNKIDLVFLDIEMEELTGIQLLKLLKNPPYVIFTTAYENYALQGFELEAVDYLLKPILFERFIMAVNKVYKRMLDKSGNLKSKDNNTGTLDDFIFIKSGFQHRKIIFNEIKYIEGQGDYLKIVTSKGNIMTLLSFKNISGLLSPNEFVRVHKSYIVAVRHIDSIERNRIKIGSETISVSETFGKSFFNMMKSKGFKV